ncbi:MAG: hypothetical protein R3338_13810, partial [Thermoanaerobaculia bacterium]|nr:hypothetical protein [Thermoanaerobaculia bacterium]
RTLQIVLTSIAAFLCGVAGWRVRGVGAGIAATAVILSSSSVLINATEIEPETMILVAVSFFLALFPWGEEPRRWTSALAGLAAGFAIALRPTFALPFLFVSGWLAWRAFSRQRSIQRSVALLMIGGSLIPVAVSFVAVRTTSEAGVSMNPGTVFYEGMNPYATGYAGVQPRIVNDLESLIGQPDSLHIAYRLVAARASGGGSTPEETNRYWADKAVQYATDFPARASRLTLSKIFFSLHSHDSWDLVTMIRKERELESLPWLPFGVALSIGIMGMLAIPRDRAIPLILLLAGAVCVMAIFYVTARQRNVLWPFVAVLAGCGLSEIARWANRRMLVHLALSALFLVPVTLILSRPWHAQQEDRYAWTALLSSTELWMRAQSAREAGELETAQRYLALDRLWLDDQDEILDLPADLLGSAAIHRLDEATSPQRAFDISLALIDAGRFEEAEKLITVLDRNGYTPLRGNAIPQSTSWQRARVALEQADRDVPSTILHEAERESPGTPEIVAAAGALRGLELSELRENAGRYVDPFSADLAIIRAMTLLGRNRDAAWMISQLEQRIPEWNRPRKLYRELRLEDFPLE